MSSNELAIPPVGALLVAETERGFRIQAARELLEFEAEAEQWEQLLVTARNGLRHAAAHITNVRIRSQVYKALNHSDPEISAHDPH